MPNKQSKTNQTINRNQQNIYKLVLQPVTMRIFNNYGVYFPSKLNPVKTVTYEEFLEQYADYPIEMLICFDEPPSSVTMLQNSKRVTAYGFGLSTYYIVIGYMARVDL